MKKKEKNPKERKKDKIKNFKHKNQKQLKIANPPKLLFLFAHN